MDGTNCTRFMRMGVGVLILFVSCCRNTVHLCDCLLSRNPCTKRICEIVSKSLSAFHSYVLMLSVPRGMDFIIDSARNATYGCSMATVFIAERFRLQRESLSNEHGIE